MMLETERLVLRNWLESDVDHYLVLAGDVGYHCFTQPGRFMVRDAKEAKAKLRERMLLFDRRKLGKFPIFLQETGKFIGTCGIEPFRLDGQSEVELGYRLCLEFWGKGYAREAAAAMLNHGFGDLKLSRIMAFVLPQNKASVKILDELGFRYLRDGGQEGMQHFDGELEKLIRAGTVDLETGLGYASNAGNLRLQLTDFVEEQAAAQAAAQAASQASDQTSAQPEGQPAEKVVMQ